MVRRFPPPFEPKAHQPEAESPPPRLHFVSAGRRQPPAFGGINFKPIHCLVYLPVERLALPLKAARLRFSLGFAQLFLGPKHAFDKINDGVVGFVSFEVFYQLPDCLECLFHGIPRLMIV